MFGQNRNNKLLTETLRDFERKISVRKGRFTENIQISYQIIKSLQMKQSLLILLKLKSWLGNTLQSLFYGVNSHISLKNTLVNYYNLLFMFSCNNKLLFIKAEAQSKSHYNYSPKI